MRQDEIIQISRQLAGHEVVAEILALSIVEFSRTRQSRIALSLGHSGGVLRDTGRGMRLTPDRGDTISHAERALTSHYPCLPSDGDVGAVLHELVWGERGSLGPSLANFACRSYRFTSMREREIWSQQYECGQPTGPATLLGSTEETGTQVEFETNRPIDSTQVERLAQSLCERIHGLSISLERASASF
jgi:DNA gyrase/topoisomerase IV subunit B